MKTEQGFTLIEILVAVTLLAVLITVVVAPVTGLFGMTRQSTQRVSATGQAQRAAEYIKSEWAIPTQYDATCVNSTLSLNTLGVVTVQALNYSGVSTSTPAFRSTCAGMTSNSTAPLKRVTIVSTVQNITARLTIDLARPQ